MTNREEGDEGNGRVPGIWRPEEDGWRLGTKADLEDTNSDGALFGHGRAGPMQEYN